MATIAAKDFAYIGQEKHNMTRSSLKLCFSLIFL
jgi:hypothetical protein